MSDWYPQSIIELQKMAADPEQKAALLKRLAELKAVNRYDIRCAMSKSLEEKIEKALAGT